MSYKGSILRGEKFAVLYTEEQMKELGGCIYEDYQNFLKSEEKVKAAEETKPKKGK